MSAAPVLYVLPNRWDHAMSAACRFARRDSLRYQVRWFPPRGCWVVSRSPQQDRCICPPDFCLGVEDQDGPGTIECRACLALDPELPCLRDIPPADGGAA